MSTAFLNAISGMQANNQWLDRTGSAITDTTVSFQAPSAFETVLGNTTVTGLDPSGTLNPGLGSLSADSLAAFNMGLGSEILDLILAQRGFQINARVATEASKDLQNLSSVA